MTLTKEIKMQKLKITVKQYLELQSLFNATLQNDNGRGNIDLSKIHYNSKKDEFLAIDGVILRIHKIIWLKLDENPEEILKPDFDFPLSKTDLMLTKNNLKNFMENPLNRK